MPFICEIARAETVVQSNPVTKSVHPVRHITQLDMSDIDIEPK
jgi:hypothetical protein